MGIPRTSIFSPIALHMSLAVPSPPAKSRRSTPRRSISFAALLVSSAVVSPFLIEPTTMGPKPHSLAASSPISLGYVTISRSSFMEATLSSAWTVRFSDCGKAPNSRAFFCISAPSLPLSPTLPPIPAIGLTIKPNFLLRLLPMN